MQTRSAAAKATSSFHPTSLAAHSQVLEVDMDLLGEVLSFLGPDVKECHAALLVNHAWREALGSVDPWLHILRRDYPSMAAAGCLISPSQQHALFRRTAKDLLRLRLINANPETRCERELRRLEELFCDEFVTLKIYHPTHGLIAEASIPIARGEGVNSLDDCFKQEKDKKLMVELAFQKLPVSEWEKCIVEWEMPGGLEMFYLEGLDVTAVDYFDKIEYTMATTYLVDARYFGEPSSTTGVRFIDDYFWGGQEYSQAFTINCFYPCYLPYCADSKMKRAERAALREEGPNGFGDAHVLSFAMPSCPSHRALPLEYLNVMDSWMVVAHHLQDDRSEFARLQLRFEEAYLLIEIGTKKAMAAGINADENSDEGEGQDKVGVDQAIDVVAYTVVSLVDGAALPDLFDTQTTPLQFVNRGNNTPQLPAVEDRFVRISVLDLGENRMVKLSEGDFFWRTSDADDREESCRITAPCQFVRFDEKIEFQPTFAEVITSGEGGDQYAVTVNLFIAYARDRYDDDDEEDWQEGVWNKSKCLDLWKILEICMTGGAA